MAKTERLEVRMTPEEYETLRTHAQGRGQKMSDLVRGQLGNLIGQPPNPEDADEPGEWHEARVDLAQWLSGRTGLPKAICALKIARGKVRVAGSPWNELEAPSSLIGDGVELDGERV